MIKDTDFHLGDIEFDAESLDESVLELTDLDNLDSQTFSDLDYFDAGEVNTTVPFRSKDAEELAREIEDTFIGLMESGDTTSILHLTGENPIASCELPEDLVVDFKTSYFKAVSHNPAIKWYAKLAKIMPTGKFGIKDGNLRLAMTPKMFRKALLPFFGDFNIQNRDSSPITDLIFSLAQNIQEDDIQAKLVKIMENSVQLDAMPEEDLKPESIDMSDSMLDISNVHDGELNVDEFDVMSGPSVDDSNNEIITPIREEEDRPTLSISLRDLSLKAISDWVIDQELSDSEIESSLAEEGFNRSQINNVMGIVKYRRVDSILKPKGNIGEGDVDFPFKM